MSTPPELSEIGLCTAERMSKLEAEKAKAKATGQPHDGVDDELFVKRPTFSWRRASTKSSSMSGEALTIVNPAKEENGLASFTHFMNRLPAQRWMWCEFAQSFIDEPIAGSAFYDLDKLIKDLGYLIATRTMPRRCWQLVRQPIGKPRRFSQAFIAADVEEWEHLRDLVRQMQKGTFDVKKHETDLPLLPRRVPMTLAMDTKVTTYLPSGFGHGVVVSHEPKDNTYLVKLSVGGAAKEKEKEQEQEKKWLRLIDKKLQGDMGCESLPLPIMMAKTDEPDLKEAALKTEEKAATFSSAGFSQTLLESVVAMKNLMIIKQKTVDDFTELNKEFETLRAQPSSRRNSKSNPERDEQQRCFAAHMITLHRVNEDMLKPLRVLHQYLDEYKEMEDLKAKTMSARERFQRCRLQVDLDLKAAETQLGLVVSSDATRDLIRTLHTILYLCGALSGKNSSDIRTIIDDIVASTMENLPPDLSAIFKQMISKVTPLCEGFGRVPEEPTLEDEPIFIQPKPLPKPLPKPQAKAQSKPKLQPKAQSKPKLQTKAQPQPKPKLQPQPQIQLQPQPQILLQPQPQIQLQPQPQILLQPQPQIQLQPQPQILLQPQPQIQEMNGQDFVLAEAIALPLEAYGLYQSYQTLESFEQMPEQHNIVFEDMMEPLLDNLFDE